MITNDQLFAYFKRIGLLELWHLYQENPESFCTKENLKTLVFYHTKSIPFENLDMHNKLHGTDIPIPIDFPSVFKKIVTDDKRRGGYCFETSGLLKIILIHLGFQIRDGIASVYWLKDKPAVRTHIYLIATIGNQELLVDPGFGQPGPIVPLILKENGNYFYELQSFPNYEASAYQIVDDPNVKDGFILLAKIKHWWQPESDLKPLYASDPMENFDEATLIEQNRIMSASPQSHFLTRLIMTQPFDAGNGKIGRYTLSQTELKRWLPDTESQIIESFTTQEEFMRVLKLYFNIELPPGSDLTAKQIKFTSSVDSSPNKLRF